MLDSLEYIAQYYDIQYERPSNSKKSVDLRYLKRIVLGSLTVQKLEQSLQVLKIIVGDSTINNASSYAAFW